MHTVKQTPCYNTAARVTHPSTHPPCTFQNIQLDKPAKYCSFFMVNVAVNDAMHGKKIDNRWGLTPTAHLCLRYTVLLNINVLSCRRQRDNTMRGNREKVQGETADKTPMGETSTTHENNTCTKMYMVTFIVQKYISPPVPPRDHQTARGAKNILLYIDYTFALTNTIIPLITIHEVCRAKQQQTACRLRAQQSRVCAEDKTNRQ